MIVLGLFNGLVFLPVLLVMVGPPSQVEPTGDRDCLPPATPEPSPPRFKLKPHKPKTSRSSEKKEVRSSSKEASCHKPRRHNSEVSLSTIAEENSQYSQSSLSSDGSVDQHEPGSVQTSLNGGTSVFLEPHITVETTTVPANVSRSQLHNHHHRHRCHVLRFVSQRVALTTPLLTEHQRRLLPLLLAGRPGHQGDGHRQVQAGAAHAPRVGRQAKLPKEPTQQLGKPRRGRLDALLPQQRPVEGLRGAKQPR